MTISKRLSIQEPSTEMIVFDGGLNEAVSSIEMPPGELIACSNYYLTDGSTGGYVSISGYERYDGTALASTVAAPGGDLTDRDIARGLITSVPGVDPVLGVHMYKGVLYAFRNDIDGIHAKMWKATAGGWIEVDTSADPILKDGEYRFVNYNFSDLADTESMYWCDGVNNAREYNDVTGAVVKIETNTTPDAPQYLVVHQHYLFFSFPGGYLIHGGIGEPIDWSIGTGDWGIGADITALHTTVGGTLVIFCRNKIKIMEGDSPDNWVMKGFSDHLGAMHNTVREIFDTLVFVSDYGVTTLSAAQEFGDFKSASVSDKIKKTFLKYKDTITCTVVIRELNQYRVYLSSGKILVFSFFNKKMRGITICQYPIGVLTVTEGRDLNNNPVVYFTNPSGYVFKSDSGTSFDGVKIITKLSTAYYHYKSPRNWKRFFRVTFEISSVNSFLAYIRTAFDYSKFTYAKSSAEDLDVTGAGDLWGEGEWGEMVYASTESTNRIFYDINAIGANMSITIMSESDLIKQHTIQNMVVDYQTVGRQM